MNSKILRNYDFVLLFTIIVLSLFGILMVTASTVPAGTPLMEMLKNSFVSKQIFFVVVGTGAMLVMSLIDYSEWRQFVIPFYLLNLALLAIVMIMGHSALGAQRWIDLGFFKLQPSEFAKIAIIITLSSIMAKEGRKIEGWLDLIIPFAHVSLPMLLIFLQPDLGTSLVFIAITGVILFVAGLKWLQMAVLATGGLMGSIYAFFFVFRDYQRGRLIIFLDPWQDPLGMGWQIIQSKIAIGSGQFWGRGLFGGTQTQLNFLPEKHTDFIFSVIGEELGFLGGSLTLLVYLFLVWQIIGVGLKAKDNLGRFICVGVAAMLVFQLLVNVGMTIGIMPVTGLPLPLISSGGSSFVATCLGLGLVLSVAAHSDTSMF